MSKSLSNLLTVFKVLRVISKIVLILAIAGGAGCLVAACILPALNTLMPNDLASMGVYLPTLYLALVAGVFACAGEAVFAFFAERYCVRVLRVGTPFTFDGAKECFRLGVISLIVSLATTVVAEAVIAISFIISPSAQEPELEISLSITMGLLLFFLSMIFKHGAELRQDLQAAKSAIPVAPVAPVAPTACTESNAPAAAPVEQDTPTAEKTEA